MVIKTITNYLEEVAPLNYQEGYDNAGLIVGDENAEVTGVLLCLDSTEAVVEEAVKKGCNLIIAHHPIVFGGLKRFNGHNYVERTVISAIKNDVAIYAIHTNLDNVLEGVNNKIAQKLGLQNLKILKVKHGQDTTVGSGMLGEVPTIRTVDFLNQIKSTFGGTVRYTAIVKDEISKIAVCGGSGSFLLKDAIGAGADLFLTSDFKYHQFFDAENQLVIADIGHYEAEICTQELISELLSQKFATFTLHFSEVNTNPVNYL